MGEVGEAGLPRFPQLTKSGDSSWHCFLTSILGNDGEVKLAPRHTGEATSAFGRFLQPIGWFPARGWTTENLVRVWKLLTHSGTTS
jgi:hypothetical protein